jgi:predicted DCC family thiol-disulfide oxidoreductase YuxK
MWILRHDKNRQFLFAPLSGKTAKRYLDAHFDKSTMVLIEASKGRRWLCGKAAFRVFWLLGGKWKWIGWLYVMPFIDPLYRLIAFYRARFFKQLPLNVFKERFLP